VGLEYGVDEAVSQDTHSRVRVLSVTQSTGTTFESGYITIVIPTYLPDTVHDFPTNPSRLVTHAYDPLKDSPSRADILTEAGLLEGTTRMAREIEDLGRQLKALILSLPNVRAIYVTPYKRSYSVRTVIGSDDYSLRMDVYTREQIIFRLYPNINFEFSLEVSSEPIDIRNFPAGTFQC
jgi:hypothetical protein